MHSNYFGSTYLYKFYTVHFFDAVLTGDATYVSEKRPVDHPEEKSSKLLWKDSNKLRIITASCPGSLQSSPRTLTSGVCPDIQTVRLSVCPSYALRTDRQTDTSDNTRKNRSLRIESHGCRWPRGLGRRSAASRLLGLRVLMPLRAWMFVSYVCRM
jgi:hypothetical protein